MHTIVRRLTSVALLALATGTTPRAQQPAVVAFIKVLLERNLLQDISNSSTIAAVVLDGRLMGRQELDTHLARVRQAS